MTLINHALISLIWKFSFLLVIFFASKTFPIKWLSCLLTRHRLLAFIVFHHPTGFGMRRDCSLGDFFIVYRIIRKLMVFCVQIEIISSFTRLFQIHLVCVAVFLANLFLTLCLVPSINDETFFKTNLSFRWAFVINRMLAMCLSGTGRHLCNYLW